jgi:hypothetical protein
MLRVRKLNSPVMLNGFDCQFVAPLLERIVYFSTHIVPFLACCIAACQSLSGTKVQLQMTNLPAWPGGLEGFCSSRKVSGLTPTAVFVCSCGLAQVSKLHAAPTAVRPHDQQTLHFHDQGRENFSCWTEQCKGGYLTTEAHSLVCIYEQAC